jgi:hypothetical protein
LDFSLTPDLSPLTVTPLVFASSVLLLRESPLGTDELLDDDEEEEW